jgi:hypothetical protein
VPQRLKKCDGARRNARVCKELHATMDVFSLASHAPYFAA